MGSPRRSEGTHKDYKDGNGNPFDQIEPIESYVEGVMSLNAEQAVSKG